MKAASLVLFSLISSLSTCFVYADVTATLMIPSLRVCKQNTPPNEMQDIMNENNKKLDSFTNIYFYTEQATVIEFKHFVNSVNSGCKQFMHQ